MTSTRDILSHARAFPPQHSTSVMAPLPPGVAYRRFRTRKPEFLMFPPPWEGEAPAEPQTSRLLSHKPNRQPRASPPPNLARSSSPSGTTRRKSCDGAPQLAQGAALRFVGYREFGLTVPRHPANPARSRGWRWGFTQSHRALGRSLPACRNRWARLFVKQAVSGQPRRGNRERQRHRTSHLQRATPRQPGANESSRPTGTSATGPAGAHDSAAAGHNFTADTATIRSVARAYDGLAAHHPRRQRPQRGNPTPPDSRHPPLGDSVDPPADRLPDPHAIAAPAHPRASRQPGFELRPWPQGTLIVAFRSAKGTSTPRRAKVDKGSLARRQSVLSLVTQMGLTLRIRCNLSPPPASPQHRCEPCLEKSVRWRGPEKRVASAAERRTGMWPGPGSHGAIAAEKCSHRQLRQNRLIFFSG